MNTEYTFENFIIGNSNRLAYAAAVAVTDGNKKSRGYNPLLICGDSGLGKTHLLYAIRYAIEKKFPHYKVIHVTGEGFVNSLVDAFKHGNEVEFRDKFKGIDFLLTDDIQFIADCKKAQEEYLSIFNALYNCGKQIVITSDRLPKEMFNLEDKLRARLEFGFLVDIQHPDDDICVSIIKSKAEQLGMILQEDVIKYISENLNKNVCQLEGAVKLVMAYHELKGEDVSVENIKKHYKDAYINSDDFIPSVDVIIEETAKYFMLVPIDIKSRSRATEVKNARHISMCLARHMTNYSFADIGKLFGNRQRSSVLAAVRNIEDKKNHDTNLANTIKDITSNIQSKIGGH